MSALQPPVPRGPATLGHSAHRGEELQMGAVHQALEARFNKVVCYYQLSFNTGKGITVTKELVRTYMVNA